MTTAVAYCRVSGQGQIEGDGFPRQESSIRKFAFSNGYSIFGWYRDEGVSGRTEFSDRDGMTLCMESCRENGINVVIVESADRLARDLIISELLIAEFQKAGITVLAANGGVNLTEGDELNPTAKLIRQILAAVAEFDRSVTVIKLRGARQRKKAQTGRCEGVKPYGSLPGERPILDEILRLQSLNCGMEEIANRLNQGTRSRHSKPWRASTIRKIIKAQTEVQSKTEYAPC